MIVCHCYSVSDRQIRRCTQEGACNVSEVGRACGAGTGCGGCRPEIANIVAEGRESVVRTGSALLAMLTTATNAR